MEKCKRGNIKIEKNIKKIQENVRGEMGSNKIFTHSLPPYGN